MQIWRLVKWDYRGYHYVQFQLFPAGGHWFHPVHMKVFTHKITILGFIK